MLLVWLRTESLVVALPFYGGVCGGGGGRRSTRKSELFIFLVDIPVAVYMRI